MDNLSDLKKIILDTLAECRLNVYIFGTGSGAVKVTLSDKNGNILLEDCDYQKIYG